MKYVGKYDKFFIFKNEGNLIDFKEYVIVFDEGNQLVVKVKVRFLFVKCLRVKIDNIENIIFVVFNLVINQQVYGEEIDLKCSLN